MTREADRNEIEALRRALDTACDEIQAQRDNATRATIRAERAIAQRIPTRPTRNPVTHALAFAAGMICAALMIFAMHVLY